MKPSPHRVRELARCVVERLREAGHEAFWVGGCVRDFLRGKEPVDFDVATSAGPPEVERLFARTIPVGRQFGVIIVLLEGIEFEVATFRAEADYQDGRRPNRVSFATARADAARRDFTINGLFYDPLTEAVHDWVGGRADLAAGLVRTIGEPAERFAEDHLRMLRAVRFAAQLGFQIHPATFAAVQAGAPAIQVISAERIRDELLKLFRPPHAARGLVLLRDSGLLDQVLPEVAALAQCQQSPGYHPEGDVFAHVCQMLEQLPPDASAVLPWAVLLHDIAKPRTASVDSTSGTIHFYGHEQVGAAMAEAILRRLRFPRRERELAVALVRHHMRFVDVPRMRPATRRRLVLRPHFSEELALHRLDCLGSNGRLETYDLMVAEAAKLVNQPAKITPLVNGHDLIALGYHGPQLGQLLGEIRERQLFGELKTAEEARAWLRARPANPDSAAGHPA